MRAYLLVATSPPPLPLSVEPPPSLHDRITWEQALRTAKKYVFTSKYGKVRFHFQKRTEQYFVGCKKRKRTRKCCEVITTTVAVSATAQRTAVLQNSGIHVGHVSCLYFRVWLRVIVHGYASVRLSQLCLLYTGLGDGSPVRVNITQRLCSRWPMRETHNVIPTVHDVIKR